MSIPSRALAPITRRGALLLCAGALAGCGRSGDGDSLSSMNAAVKESSPRVQGVLFSSREKNGFGQALYIGLTLDSPTPPTTDELDAVVEAIWTNAPWEPNAIRIVAQAGADEQPVDLLPGAQGLGPVAAGSFGQSGVSLIGMSKRYGAWRKP